MAQINDIEVRCQGSLIAKAKYAELNTPADAHKLTVPKAEWVGSNFKDNLKYLEKSCQLTGKYPPNGSAYKATLKLAGIKGGTTLHFD